MSPNHRFPFAFAVVSIALALSSCTNHEGPSGGVVPGTALIPDVVQHGNPPLNWIAFRQGFNYPESIVRGANGNLWVAIVNGSPGPDEIASVGMDGSISTTITLPTQQSSYRGIALGPDGNIWLAIYDAGNGKDWIARAKPSGTVTLFTAPGFTTYPDITNGPDGNLWFTTGNGVGKITTAGQITLYSLPSGGHYSYSIRKGPDGALWFTDCLSSEIGRVTTSGSFSFVAVPTGNSCPWGITDGPDGNMWFTEQGQIGAPGIGRITPAGVITEFHLSTKSQPMGIRAGVDGSLWFTDAGRRAVGRITTGGQISETVVPIDINVSNGIASGPDGNIWLTWGYTIAVRVIRILTVTPTTVSLSASGQTATLTVREFHFSGTWTAVSSNTGVATVAPGSGRNFFVVTAAAQGSCVVTVADTAGNSFPVNVTVQ